MTEERTSDSRDMPVKGGGVKAVTDVFTVIADTVSGAVTDAVKAAGNVGTSVVDSISEVARGALASIDARRDLSPAAKGIVVGVLRGTRETGPAALRTISHTARIVVLHSARLGADLARATQGLVQGAIQGARELGLDTVQAASAATQAAVEAAEEVGSVAVEKVRHALKGTLDGVKVVLKEPSQNRTRK